MKLYDIYTAISSGADQLLSEQDAFATMVAIEHLARFEGIPLSALDFSAPKFGAKYTRDFSASHGWKGNAHYFAWRNLILNAQLLYRPADVDANPWGSLSRADRLSRNVTVSPLSELPRNLPQGTHPRNVTDDFLFNIGKELQNKAYYSLRTGVLHFRELFKNDLAVQSGLLPEKCPAPLPVRSKNINPPMSAEIEAWFDTLDTSTKNAFRYISRIAIYSGQMDGKTDTLEDLRSVLCDLPHLNEPHVKAVTETTFSSYVTKVIRGLAGPDPRKTPVEQAWADLWTAAQAQGCNIKALWGLRNPASARGIFPAHISQQIASELMLLSENRAMLSTFRKGCEQFDALRGKVPPDILPPYPLGIKPPPPRPPRVPKPILEPDPVKVAWADLYARLRTRGWNARQASVLSYLRVRACAAGLKPGTLSKDFIGALERDITRKEDRTRLRAAVLCISDLSKEPGFSELPLLSAPEDRRFSHGGAGEQARTELEELLEFMNAAAPTRRNFRVAVGVVTDAMGRPDITLKDILRTDMSAYDLCEHEPRRKTHTKNIRNLREFIELPWTPAWRELQKVVTGTGITPLQNPVPKVLSWKPGIDPRRIKLAWAQRLDRDLRSTLKNSPHGRADLALTLARHLKAFDGLHDIPEVASSGLLPPRIGPIR